MTKKTSALKKKTPWPTKDAMVQVYNLQLWGKNKSEFYSGTGSHLPELVNPYIEVITLFLKSFSSPIVVCDLGCGDFNIGKQLVEHTKKYVAIDIVPDLITHNQNTYKFEHLEFKCLDLAADDLPVGDCAFLRQVLQHLSNAEIQNILNKLSSFKYVILTEHIPEGPFIPNIDIISGQGIRLKKQSGVNVLAPPFNFKVQNASQLLSIPLEENKGVLVTTCYKLH